MYMVAGYLGVSTPSFFSGLPLLTVRIVTPWTIVLLFIPFFLGTTLGIVMVSRLFSLCSPTRINVLPAKLFATGPAPGTTTPTSDYKSPTPCLKSAGKDVVTRVVFQAPPGTPGALFGVGHLVVPYTISLNKTVIHTKRMN